MENSTETKEGKTQLNIKGVLKDQERRRGGKKNEFAERRVGEVNKCWDLK